MKRRLNSGTEPRNSSLLPATFSAAVRTLIIAASAERQTALKKSLEGAAPIVVTAALPHLAAARQYLRQGQADVVLLDLESTPKPAEIESLLELCSGGTHEIPVVLLVEHVEPVRIGQLLSSGASSILQRDSSPEQIATAIRASTEELVVLSPEALEDLLAERGTDAADLEPLIEELTPRELEVLRMAAAGLANREIAERLVISEHTIKFHMSSILGKLGASSRTEAVAQGIKRGLVLL